MRLNKEPIMPAYVDGCMDVYDLVDVTERDAPDFPVRMIKKRKIGAVGFRELAVFDRTRLEFEQAHIEIQLKVAIPKWDGINSDCVIVTGGRQYKVYNCAHVVSKQGYAETELTLVSPEMQYEIWTEPTPDPPTTPTTQEPDPEVNDDDDES